MTYKQATRIKVLIDQLEQEVVRANEANARLNRTRAELTEAIEQATDKGDWQP